MATVNITQSVDHATKTFQCVVCDEKFASTAGCGYHALVNPAHTKFMESAVIREIEIEVIV